MVQVLPEGVQWTRAQKDAYLAGRMNLAPEKLQAGGRVYEEGGVMKYGAYDTSGLDQANIGNLEDPNNPYSKYFTKVTNKLGDGGASSTSWQFTGYNPNQSAPVTNNITAAQLASMTPEQRAASGFSAAGDTPQSTLTPEQFRAKQDVYNAQLASERGPNTYTTYNPDGSIKYQGAGDVASVNAMGQASEAALSAANKASYVPPTSKDIQQGIQNIDPKGLTIPTTILQTGAKGDAVKALQDYLVKAGFMTQAQVNTGYGNYGPQTTAAVLALQKSLNMDYSSGPGQFGPKTIAALQAKNKVTPGTTPGAPTATGLGAGAGKPIDLGGLGGGVPTGPITAGSTVSGAQQFLADYMKMRDGEDSVLKKEYDKLKAQFLADTESMGGRGAAQAEAEAQRGVETLKKNLADVNGQIGTKIAEYKSLEAAQNLANMTTEGKAITLSSIQGQQAQNDRIFNARKTAMAADIGMLQAQALGLQGNLQAAQESANRAVDLKYADAEDALNLHKAQLDLIMGELDKEEAKKADGINLFLEYQKQEMADKKAEEKQRANYALDASTKYISAGINPTDDYATVQKKIQGSREYQLDMKEKSSSGSGGLTAAQINSTVNSIAGAFDNEPIVKEYNTIRRAVDMFNNLGTSATDDIQRVYAFAKIADPNSAVKEGEYDSIEKYSQALLQRAGLRLGRVFTATGVLTPQAREAMSSTIGTSLNAAERAYTQVKSEYDRQVEDAYAGRPRQITQYTPSSPTTSTTQTSSTPPAQQGFWSSLGNWLWGSE